METVVVVTYPATPGARFDHAYYAATHLNLVRDSWSAHGLISAQALYPAAGSESPFLAIALLRFRDAQAVAAAMAAPQSAAVFADISNFTDAEPAVHQMIDA